jgi:hypothetical protein
VWHWNSVETFTSGVLPWASSAVLFTQRCNSIRIFSVRKIFLWKIQKKLIFVFSPSHETKTETNQRETPWKSVVFIDNKTTWEFPSWAPPIQESMLANECFETKPSTFPAIEIQLFRSDPYKKISGPRINSQS